MFHGSPEGKATVNLLHQAQSIMRRAGLDVRRYPAHSPGYLRARALASHDIDVVLDVGANRGQYGTELRSFGYRGRIVSFEPLQEPFRQLSIRAVGDDSWSTMRCALGQDPAEVVLHVAANDGASSSVLPMLDSHIVAAPYAQYVGTETVQQLRLDEAVGDLLSDSSRAYLKCDVQGYEKHVLAGGPQVLKSAVGVELELSFVPLYEGGMLYVEAIALLEEHGFALHFLFPGFSDPTTGRLLQGDGVFFRA